MIVQGRVFVCLHLLPLLVPALEMKVVKPRNQLRNLGTNKTTQGIKWSNSVKKINHLNLGNLETKKSETNDILPIASVQ